MYPIFTSDSLRYEKMSLAYSPQAAQQLFSSTSMSITSVHIRLVFIMSGEENSIGEPGQSKTWRWHIARGTCCIRAQSDVWVCKPGDLVASLNDTLDPAAGAAAEIESHAFASISSLMGSGAMAGDRKLSRYVCCACTQNKGHLVHTCTLTR